jgi:predicted nucleotidyltransferase
MRQAREIESKLIELKPILADRFNVSRIGYFGSYAAGLQTQISDLDLLVEFSKPVGWEFFTLEKFLEDEFGLRVDLVTKEALRERIKSPILDQVKYI